MIVDFISNQPSIANRLNKITMNRFGGPTVPQPLLLFHNITFTLLLKLNRTVSLFNADNMIEILNQCPCRYSRLEASFSFLKLA